MLRARKVDEFMSAATGYDMSWLQLLMTTASGGFFGNVWIPARQYDPNTGKMSETYTYYNIGLQPDELANLYWTQYSGNYFIGGGRTIDTDYTYLSKRCRATFLKNLGKYKKLVEIEGLEWNPLWNVDGTELHQILEQEADEVTKDTGSGESFRGQNLRDKREVTPYDTSDLKTEYHETHTGLDGEKTPSASSTIGDVTVSSSTTTAVPSVSESEASASSSVNVRTHDSFDYAVAVKDAAFGVALTGGDSLHTEKTVRQGNIGVTETTTLLNHARDYVQFNIVQEFFDDINKVILIGTYDY